MLARGAWVALPAALAADELADEAVGVLVGVQSGGGGLAAHVGRRAAQRLLGGGRQRRREQPGPRPLGVVALLEIVGARKRLPQILPALAADALDVADGTVRTTAAEEAEAAANAAAAVAAAPAAAPAQRAAIARRVTTLLRAERIASVLREQRDSERRSSWFTRMSAVRRDGAMG